MTSSHYLNFLSVFFCNFFFFPFEVLLTQKIIFSFVYFCFIALNVSFRKLVSICFYAQHMRIKIEVLFVLHTIQKYKYKCNSNQPFRLIFYNHSNSHVGKFKLSTIYRLTLKSFSQLFVYNFITIVFSILIPT